MYTKLHKLPILKGENILACRNSVHATINSSPMHFNFKAHFPAKTQIPIPSRQLIKCSASALPKAPQDLKLVGDIKLTTTNVAVNNRSVSIVVADVDAVMQMYIDAGQGDRDPYWTCIWPSSIAMAQEVLQNPELVAGKKVADLGCGLGLGGVAAGLAGASEVVFLDREPLALQCSLLNSLLASLPTELDPETLAAAKSLVANQQAPAHLLQGLSDANNNERTVDTLEATSQCRVRAEVFDWSQPLSSLLHYFDVVLACDVLYEAFSVEPVAKIAPKLLKVTSTTEGGGENDNSPGVILLADPPLRAKQNRDRFLELLKSDGYFPVTDELGQRSARVFEEAEKVYKHVAIEFMVLQKDV
jgi:predicted nicotinamide N-methyase